MKNNTFIYKKLLYISNYAPLTLVTIYIAYVLFNSSDFIRDSFYIVHWRDELYSTIYLSLIGVVWFSILCSLISNYLIFERYASVLSTLLEFNIYLKVNTALIFIYYGHTLNGAAKPNLSIVTFLLITFFVIKFSYDKRLKAMFYNYSCFYFSSFLISLMIVDGVL